MTTRRYYHDGSPLNHPSVIVKGIGPACRLPAQFAPIDPLTGNEITTYVHCPPGSVRIGFPGVGFYVCGPGGFVDIPVEVSRAAIRSAAPQLLDEEEYRAARAREEV